MVRDARVVNPRLSTYLMPGIGDIPEKVTCVVVEAARPARPVGRTRHGRDADDPLCRGRRGRAARRHRGVVRSYPLTPDRVVAALRQRERDRSG